MTSERFNRVLDSVIKKCTDTLGKKAEEYATNDRLHNFKTAASLLNCSPIMALTGMMAKHTVSVYDLIQEHEQGVYIPQELWDEKIGDSINYLILLSALITEEKEEGCDTPCNCEPSDSIICNCEPTIVEPNSDGEAEE